MLASVVCSPYVVNGCAEGVATQRDAGLGIPALSMSKTIPVPLPKSRILPTLAAPATSSRHITILPIIKDELEA